MDIDWVYANPHVLPFVGEFGLQRPDYVIVNHAVRELIVLEVKGNSSSRGVAVRQLARGIDQVRAFPDCQGYRIRRLVIATVATNSSMRAYAIEVPAEDPIERTKDLRELAVEKRRLRVRFRASDGVSAFYARAAADIPVERAIIFRGAHWRCVWMGVACKRLRV